MVSFLEIVVVVPVYLCCTSKEEMDVQYVLFLCALVLFDVFHCHSNLKSQSISDRVETAKSRKNTSSELSKIFSLLCFFFSIVRYPYLSQQNVQTQEQNILQFASYYVKKTYLVVFSSISIVKIYLLQYYVSKNLTFS